MNDKKKMMYAIVYGVWYGGVSAAATLVLMQASNEMGTDPWLIIFGALFFIFCSLNMTYIATKKATELDK